jgi:hypothetical protein
LKSIAKMGSFTLDLEIGRLDPPVASSSLLT